MIPNLLKHVVNMTGHRDHAMLDAAIIAAMQELVGAKHMRALEIYRHDGELYMRQRAWLNQGKIELADEHRLHESEGELVTQYPELAACIAEHGARTTRSDGSGSIMWLPIWLNDRIATCLELHSDKPYSLQAAHIIEGVLSVYRNYQNLLDYSERDSLTGLLNRKTFDERFSRLVANVSEQEQESAEDLPERRRALQSKAHWLGVVDIDHFKRVNDQFGHLYGDEVLILVANLLRTSFRAHDRVFRFGGEEFVVLLRSAELDDALRIFERFRQNVEEHAFPQIGRVTVSIGFARIADQTPVVILGHADRALYHAKASGRNRVYHYDTLVESGLLRSEASNASVEFFFDSPN
ncbi:MAG: GGDEF domain-containing protein [Burkholderiaceae bacterium]|nr:GGDEF domain-containing protein [Burkholderiaceae bacterium]